MSCVSYYCSLQIQQSAMLSLLTFWKHFLPLPIVRLCVAFVEVLGKFKYLEIYMNCLLRM